MMPVYDAPGTGFGDLWAALGYVARRNAGISTCIHGKNVRARLEEMRALMKDGVLRVRIEDVPPTKSMHMDCWGEERWPSIFPHAPSAKTVIAFQFDGRSSDGEKNPLFSDMRLFHTWAEAQGIETISVGLPLSMQDCALRLSQATAFVGVCSGMSHLAHSVKGLPVYLLQYQLDVAWWHGKNPFEVCNGVGAFIELFSRKHPR